MKSRLLKEAAASVLKKLDQRISQIRKDDEDQNIHVLHYDFDGTIICHWNGDDPKRIVKFQSEIEVEKFFFLNKIDSEDPNTLIVAFMPYSIAKKLGRLEDA